MPRNRFTYPGLKSHFWTYLYYIYLGIIQGEYSCHVCQHKSNFKSKLKIHIRRKHGEKEVQKAFPPKIIQSEYSCHVCQHKSNFKSNLRKHIRKLHGADELELRKDLDQNGENTCHVCDYTTQYHSNLKTHIVKKHGEDELENIMQPMKG